jgi:hypothetical protein
VILASVSLHGQAPLFSERSGVATRCSQRQTRVPLLSNMDLLNTRAPVWMTVSGLRKGGVFLHGEGLWNRKQDTLLRSPEAQRSFRFPSGSTSQVRSGTNRAASRRPAGVRSTGCTRRATDGSGVTAVADDLPRLAMVSGLEGIAGVPAQRRGDELAVRVSKESATTWVARLTQVGDQRPGGDDGL